MTEKSKQEIPLTVGLLGISTEAISQSKWGYCLFPVGPYDMKTGQREWVRVRIHAMEDIRKERDVVVANPQGDVKEHTPVELSYEKEVGGYERVGESTPLPIKLEFFKTKKETTELQSSLGCTIDDHDYESDSMDCQRRSKFLLEYKITENGTLVDGDRLIFKVQFSDDETTWYDYQNGPFGYLAEEESTTPCNKSVSGDCAGEYMRVVVTTDYTNADPTTNYFTVTVKVTLVN